MNGKAIMATLGILLVAITIATMIPHKKHATAQAAATPVAAEHDQETIDSAARMHVSVETLVLGRLHVTEATHACFSGSPTGIMWGINEDKIISVTYYGPQRTLTCDYNPITKEVVN